MLRPFVNSPAGLRVLHRNISRRLIFPSSRNQQFFLPSAAIAANRLLVVQANEFSTIQQSKFAAVDHGAAYEEEMKGRHGKQLALAQLEGWGKDDPPFDPFSDDEHEDDDEDYDEEKEDGEAEGEDDDDEEEDDVREKIEKQIEEFRRQYNNDGSLRWSKSDRAVFRAGAPAGGMFAVIELAGSQFKVTNDDVLIVNKLKPVDKYKVGSVHTIKDVVLVGSSHLTLVGMPHVGGAEVDVMVEEITRDKKVIVFKKRRRKNSQRKNGFRRDLTFLRILDIRPPQDYTDHHHVKRQNPDS